MVSFHVGRPTIDLSLGSWRGSIEHFSGIENPLWIEGFA